MPTLEVENDDGELLGYFVVGDPFIVQNRERHIVAKFNSFDGGDCRTILYQCILECSGEEIGRLEPRKSQLSQLQVASLLVALISAVTYKTLKQQIVRELTYRLITQHTT